MQRLRIALRSLAAHRMRTALAMLGVFLGALALTAVLHISKAMVKKADIETQRLGPNLLQALSGQASFRREGATRVTGMTTTFSLEDAREILDSVPQVRLGVPYASGSMPVRYGRVKTGSQLMASPPAYAQVRLLETEHGRFYNEEEEATQAKVCVLGYAIAQRLFGDPAEAVGKQVFFFRANVLVVGVLPEKGQDVTGTNLDEMVFTPLSTYMRRFSNQDWISGVFMNLHGQEDEDVAKAAVTDILRRRHHMGPARKDDFSVISARDSAKLRNQALDLVWTLGVLSSSISFAVGALGILHSVHHDPAGARPQAGDRHSPGRGGQPHRDHPPVSGRGRGDGRGGRRGRGAGRRGHRYRGVCRGRFSVPVRPAADCRGLRGLRPAGADGRGVPGVAGIAGGGAGGAQES